MTTATHSSDKSRVIMEETEENADIKNSQSIYKEGFSTLKLPTTDTI